MSLITYSFTRYLYRTLNVTSTCKRYCSLKTNFSESDSSIKFEITKNPDEWKYVERVLPPKIVPEPKLLSEYPSGWKPQMNDVKHLPYYIPRNKNHMIPVYLKIAERGTKRHTYVKNIEGDIWLLEKELVEFLQKDQVRPIRSQVNELVRYICINGDHVNAIKYFLMKKNL